MTCVGVDFEGDVTVIWVMNCYKIFFYCGYYAIVNGVGDRHVMGYFFNFIKIVLFSLQAFIMLYV